jgi:8-oxo-dGTP diphosphatase
MTSTRQNPDTSPEPIRTVAAVIRDEAGRVLLVRKHGSQVFIQPGGKREPGEDSLATLARELQEELGVELVTASAQRLGQFEDRAVNEPGRRVSAEVFLARVEGEPVAAAELAELAWISPRPPFPVQVAPLSAHHILPLLGD